VTARRGTDKSNEQSLRLRALYGCPDVGARSRKLLKQAGKTQRELAPALGISEGQFSKMLSDQHDMTLGIFLHVMHVVKEQPSAFLGDKNRPRVELVQALRQVIDIATLIVEPFDSAEGSDDRRQVKLLLVAATPDNETYDDDDDARLFALPPEYDKRDTGAFEVVGDSMRGDAIASGDIVITRPVRTLQQCDGDIVVCSVHGYRHLKRLRYRHGKVALESSTPQRKLWVLNPSERRSLLVIGVVVHQSRRIAR